MILAWGEALLPILATIVLLWVPGSLALAGLRVRGLAMLALAPLVSVAIISVAGVLFGLAGVHWSPVSAAVAAAVVVVICWGIGRLIGVRDLPWTAPVTAERASRWVLPLGIGLGAVFGAWRLIAYIQDPTGISQTNDAVFHMNAVRYLIESGSASSFDVNGFIGASSFYPAGWHGLVASVVQLTGAEIPLVANAVTVVIGALIWPIGLMFLARVVFASDLVAAVAAIAAGALQTFPLLMFQWGVLFPNALSTALLPAGIAAVLLLPDWAGRLWRRGWPSVVGGAGVLASVLAAIAFAQPAGLLVWALVVAVWLTARLLSAPTLTLTLRLGIIVLGWLALGGFWLVLARGTSGSHWPPFRGNLRAFVDVFLNGQMRIPIAIGVSAFMVIGLIAALLTKRLRWFVAAWCAVSALYVVAAAVDSDAVRRWVLGPWYADPYRLAALAPIVAIPMAAWGLVWCVRRLSALAERPRQLLALGTASVGMIAVIALRTTAMPAFIEGTFDAESRYIQSDDTYLSTDERDLMESLDTLVPEGSRILGNPSTGSAFGYMLSGLDVAPKSWNPPKTEAWVTIAEHLRDAATDPTVCPALEAFGGADYVLDFGPGEVAPGRYVFSGMTDFAGLPGFEFVAGDGEASLWQITACDR